MKPGASKPAVLAAGVALIAAAFAGLVFLLKGVLSTSQVLPDIPETPISAARQARPADRPAPGEPLGNLTNEDLHAKLEEDQKKMGIRKIVPPGEGPSVSGEKDGKAPSKAEMRKKLQETRAWMAELAAEIGYRLDAKETPPVNLHGDKPALLSDADSSRSREGAPTETAGGHAAAAPSSPLPIDGERKSPSQARKAPPLKPGTYTAHSQTELEDLWSRLNSSAAMPIVDFNREMLVLDYSGKVPDKPKDPRSPALPYQFRIVPKSR